jgi:hypothetical protein
MDMEDEPYILPGHPRQSYNASMKTSLLAICAAVRLLIQRAGGIEVEDVFEELGSDP